MLLLGALHPPGVQRDKKGYRFYPLLRFIGIAGARSMQAFPLHDWIRRVGAYVQMPKDSWLLSSCRKAGIGNATEGVARVE